jgi:hypothetical protein
MSISESTDCAMKNTESCAAISGISNGAFAGRPIATATPPRVTMSCPSSV